MLPNSSSYHVLLIEEDPKEAELYADLIRGILPCKLDVMSRVESPFEWIARSNYHLIVVDVSGFSSSLTLLEQIKRMSPVTSVIVISDRATVEEAVAAVRLGAEDYMKKPFNLEHFQLAVKRGLDKKAVLGADADVSVFFNLLNSCQMISASLEQNKIFGILQSYLQWELKSNHSAIYRRIPDGAGAFRIERIEYPAIQDGGQDRAMEEILDIALHAANPFSIMTEKGEVYRFVERGQLTPGLFVLRFRCAGPSDYFCVCLSPERPGSLEAFWGRLRMLTTQMELTGKNIEQYLGVQQLAYVDDVTGLYNTRYLNSLLDREILQAKSTNRSFAVLFIDADHFKSINDTHGHVIGSKILNELGLHLRKMVRDTDTIFRYGGDEFVAVLSPCDLTTARSVAERIRHSVEQRAFCEDDGLQLKFTLSIGVALFPDHAASKKAIIDAADHAMYSAKKTSRNSVTIASIAETAAVTGGGKEGYSD